MSDESKVELKVGWAFSWTDAAETEIGSSYFYFWMAVSLKKSTCIFNADQKVSRSRFSLAVGVLREADPPCMTFSFV